MVNHPNRSKRAKWQPIESAPKPGVELLLYSATDESWGVGGLHEVPFANGVYTWTACSSSPTHWMPLPPPPEAS